MTHHVNFHDLAKLSPAERQKLLQRTEADLSYYEDKVRTIIDAVRQEGDEALARFARQFDKAPVEAVQRYLADKDNVPLMRMFAVGFGAARPLIQNASTNESSSSGSAQTLPRRVEIHLLTNAAVERAPTRTRTSGAAARSGQNP